MKTFHCLCIWGVCCANPLWSYWPQSFIADTVAPDSFDDSNKIQTQYGFVRSIGNQCEFWPLLLHCPFCGFAQCHLMAFCTFGNIQGPQVEICHQLCHWPVDCVRLGSAQEGILLSFHPVATFFTIFSLLVFLSHPAAVPTNSPLVASFLLLFLAVT